MASGGKNNVIRPTKPNWIKPTPNTGGERGDGHDGGGEPPMIGERLARLEAAIEGLRHSQNLIIGIMAIGFAVVTAVIGYAITRIDNIPTDFERMNSTLSQAITASKQQQPQIVVVPMPVQQPTTAARQKSKP
jgi:hypothetical protein